MTVRAGAGVLPDTRRCPAGIDRANEDLRIYSADPGNSAVCLVTPANPFIPSRLDTAACYELDERLNQGFSMTRNGTTNLSTIPVIPYRAFGAEERHSVFTLARARVLLGLWLAFALLAAAPASAWEYWGGDPGGQRFSPLTQITPANVGNLVRAWEFRTGDLASRPPALMARTKFEATPLLVEDSLIFCTAFNEVIALDPASGAQKWRYDPKISESQRPGNRYVCRGVAYWVDDQAAEGATCRSRIFMGTNDYRVIALDAKAGVPCADFGTNGEVKIDIGKPLLWPGEFQITSAPVVSRGVVVVGSSICGQCPRRCAARHRARV